MHCTLMKSSLLALLTTTLANSNALAQQICHVATVPSATTNWSTTVSVPKFDPATGILTSMTFTLDGKATGAAKFESLDAGPATITMNFQSTLTLTRPDATVLVVAIPVQQFVDNVSAFDGVIDFGGTSGKTYPNVVATQSANFNSPPPASDLVLFTGLGNIVLPISAVGSSNGSGAGNLLLQFNQMAEATVTVCYNYTPDCNHNGIPDAQDILGGAPDANTNGVPDECEPSTTRYCFGDGSGNGGPDCPCGNSTPGNLNGCLNSTGLGGNLSASGIPSVSNDTLLLTASQLPLSVHSFFFQGTAEFAGGQGAPFGDGFRCVGGTIVRMGKILTPSVPGNTVVYPFPGDPPISVEFSIPAGASRFYQLWYRNFQGGPCGLYFNTTNGVRVVWGL